MTQPNNNPNPAAGAAVNPAPVIQIPQEIRNAYNKGLAALEHDNFNFAIDMFTSCIRLAPSFLAARRNLRLTEVAMYRRAKSKTPHKVASILAFPAKFKIKALLAAKKPFEALLAAEDLVKTDPLNVDFGKIYYQAAVAAKLPDAAIMTLEIMRENAPANLDIVELLGRVYHDTKDYVHARECLEKVCTIRPSSELNQLLKDSEALATLNAGWEQAAETGQDYHAVLADKKQAEQLERKAKAVKTSADADSLIREARAKIKAEPANLNYYVNLGQLLVQQKRFDEAVQVYTDARKVNAADPEIDRRLSIATVGRFDYQIEQFRAAGNEPQAKAVEAQRDKFIFQDVSERVERYPNDLRLRYELGLQLFRHDRIDDAIPQFQLAQKSPKDRVDALYYLAICFRKKGLADMAVMQLQSALEMLTSMTPQKMDVEYELGDIYQQAGKMQDAAKYYKDIYQADVTYRDISKKIEQIYSAKKA